MNFALNLPPDDNLTLYIHNNVMLMPGAQKCVGPSYNESRVPRNITLIMVHLNITIINRHCLIPVFSQILLV